ncbi:MAG: RNA 2',3'-cyclic phosphodiesterase [Pseudomonadota bacterium]
MSLRLFAALSLPDEIADLLTPLQRGTPGASWRPRENFHITLRFFGDLDGAVARDLDEELAQITETPFEIQLEGAGSFGGREPHALWIGVAPHPTLNRLAGACERAARRLNLTADKRRFKPHVTLAYCHGTQDDDAAAFISRLASFESPPFWVESFQLYSSRMGKGPSRYLDEAVYPLGSN